MQGFGTTMPMRPLGSGDHLAATYNEAPA